MAIYFGDELRSSNADFPIIDISANTSRGVVFVDSLADFTIGNVPVSKLAIGMLVVDRANGNIYVYKNTGGWTNASVDDANIPTSLEPAEQTDVFSLAGSTPSDNWKIIGNTPVFSGTIIANTGGGSFGKYEDGDEINFNGLTALEAIENALTSYQDFVASNIVFSTGSYAADEDWSDGSETTNADVEFTVFNQNRGSIVGTNNTAAVNYGIKEVKVDRIAIDGTTTEAARIFYNFATNAYVDSGGFSGQSAAVNAMNFLNSRMASGISNAATTFSFTDSNVAIPDGSGDDGNDDFLKYKVTVIALTDADNGAGTPVSQSGVSLTADDGSVNKGLIRVQGYDEPSVSFAYTLDNTANSRLAGTQTGTKRELGNLRATVTVTITRNEAEAIPSRIRIQRRTKNNSGAYTSYIDVLDTDDAAFSLLPEDGDTGYVEGMTELANGVAYDHFTFVDDSITVGNGGGYNGMTGNKIPSTDPLQLQYKVLYDDENASQVAIKTGDQAGGSSTVNFQLPAVIGYNDTAAAGISTDVGAGAVISSILADQAKIAVTASAGGAATTTKWLGDITVLNVSGSAGEIQPLEFFPNASETNSIAFPNVYLQNADGAFAGSNPLEGTFVYFAIPRRQGADLQEIQIPVIKEGGAEDITALFTDSTGDAKFTTAEVTNAYGATHEYYIFANAAPESFAGNFYTIS